MSGPVLFQGQNRSPTCSCDCDKKCQENRCRLRHRRCCCCYFSSLNHHHRRRHHHHHQGQVSIAFLLFSISPESPVVSEHECVLASRRCHSRHLVVCPTVIATESIIGANAFSILMLIYSMSSFRLLTSNHIGRDLDKCHAAGMI